MPTIYIDNEPHEVPAGHNLLAVCLWLGFDVPHFCWHPAMGSVGACRQCAVKQFKDEDDTEGKIVMACLTPAEEGVRISIDDPEAKAFRKAVSEWLMASHPHDCPVCDEGGECQLQDMTLMTGHTYRRFAYPKRTFHNQDLGPFVSHEMNRCIQCYRCVRFYNDYAGGDDLVAMGIRNQVYFGRHEDGRLESEFSGNLVEVCPTGVFTDKTFRAHFVRKWDLQTAPSICVHCGLGCNIIPGERYGVLRRIRARYNGRVNGYFICDRGRYGYGFVNARTRLRQPVVQVEVAGSTEVPGVAAPEAAAGRVAEMIRRAEEAGRPVVGIGSPRASLESNYALRALVGPDNFVLGIEGGERRRLARILSVLQEGPTRACSLRELEQADATFILGEDVTNTAPMLDYSLRQWLRRRPNQERTRLGIPDWNDSAVGRIAQEEPSALYVATVAATKLDRVAGWSYHAAPCDLCRLGFAVAALLDEGAPAVRDLPQDIAVRAQVIAEALAKAERPVVISGTSCGSETVIRAAANVAWALQARGAAAELALVVPECNSLGSVLMGGHTLEWAMRAADEPGVDVAIVLENDLFRRWPEDEAERFFDLCRRVVVIDHTASRTSQAAEVVLPAATFAESTGTLVNNEGRAQRFFQVLPADEEVRPGWWWSREILAQTGRPEAQELSGVDSILAAIARDYPVFEPIGHAAPAADFRVADMKVARQPHRYSGRTAMYADRTVFEPRPPDDDDSALAFSMEGLQVEGQAEPPAALIPRFWAPGWNSCQAIMRFQDVVLGALRGGDPGVRLIEPRPAQTVVHFSKVPPVFCAEVERQLVLPLHHIFGTEEMSMHAPAIAECAPAPYIGIGRDHAARLGVAEGDLLSVQGVEVSRTLPARIIPSLAEGVAVVPVGLPELSGFLPPLRARIIPFEEAPLEKARPEEARRV